jgi:hypothetical protein
VSTRSEPAARYYLPGAALVAAAALSGLAGLLERRRAAGSWVLAALLLAGVAGLERQLREGRRDYRSAAAELAGCLRPGDSIEGLFDMRPLAAYGIRSLVIRTPEELAAGGADWILGVDLNLDRYAGLAARLASDYELRFGIPSLRGEIRAYQRRRR